mgnify:CR=1 FL=1
MGTRTRALYAKYNIQPDIVVECPDEYSIVALVRESFGIALMPRTDIRSFLRESAFTRLKIWTFITRFLCSG